MARTKPAHRFETLLDAAMNVFIAKGFRRTQMSDVAAQARVSQGTLYNYFESKDALFFLIVERAFADPPPPPPALLPVKTPPVPEVMDRLRDRLMTDLRIAALDHALAHPAHDVRAEMEAIIREYYELTHRRRRGFDLLERSAVDIPELARLLYVERRRSIIAHMTRYLETRIKTGAIRKLPDPPTAARFIVETIVWFARHRYNTPDSAMITDEAAFATTIDLLLNALLAERPNGGERQSRRLHAGGRLR